MDTIKRNEKNGGAQNSATEDTERVGAPSPLVGPVEELSESVLDEVAGGAMTCSLLCTRSTA
jgi:hypothetical protein